MKYTIALLLIASSIIYSGCSSNVNYNAAVLQQRDGKVFLKLRGKRLLSTHDPVSFVFHKTYEDSIYLDISNSRAGIILGDNIPVPPGTYKMGGTVNVTGRNAIVKLVYDNIDDKRKDSLSWNGKYMIE